MSAMDIAECGTAFAIDFLQRQFRLDNQRNELRGINTLFKDGGEGIAIEGWRI